jgi:hypothetical protein
MLRPANRQLTATSQSAHITGRPGRQDQPEHRTALHVAGHADVPAQEPGGLLRDGQAQTAARAGPRGSRPCRSAPRRAADAPARCPGQRRPPRHSHGRRRRRSAPGHRGRVLDRVPDQVGQHPLDPARIGRQPERLAIGGHPVRQAPRGYQRRHQGPDIPPRPEPLRRQTNQYRAPTASIRRASNEHLTAALRAFSSASRVAQRDAGMVAWTF